MIPNLPVCPAKVPHFEAPSNVMIAAGVVSSNLKRFDVSKLVGLTKLH